MKAYLPVILHSQLFSGVAQDEAEAMLQCLAAHKKEYEKNRLILRFGESVDAVGMVLAGSVHVVQEDFWGNRNILMEVLPGELFAETYACMPGAASGVNVFAAEPAVILYLDVRRVLQVCSSACEFHARLVRNLLSVLAAKNLALNEKMMHISKRTTRDKLLSYLSAESQRRASAAFEIPYNRQQLADYLSVDRSAMSSELGKLRDEGVLQFDRNQFRLLQEIDRI